MKINHVKQNLYGIILQYKKCQFQYRITTKYFQGYLSQMFSHLTIYIRIDGQHDVQRPGFRWQLHMEANGRHLWASHFMTRMSGFWHWSVNKHNLLNFSKNVITRVPLCHSPVNECEPGMTLGSYQCGQFESDCSDTRQRLQKAISFCPQQTVHILRSEHHSFGIQASQNACSNETKQHKFTWCPNSARSGLR